MNKAGLAVTMTEAQLEEAVEGMARILGWDVRHIRDSRRQNAEGLPDAFLIRPPVSFWMEFKTEKGTLTATQKYLIPRMQAAGQTVYIIRPGDWLSGRVEAMLGVREF